MVEDTLSEKCMIYYGEPAREILGEIIGNIGDEMSLQGSNAVLCSAFEIV